MKVAITGASGFIGKHLSEKLRPAGHAVQVLPRTPAPMDLTGADAIVHLAGESVAQRWTSQVKQRIYSSRVDGTRRLIEAISRSERRARVLICASAIGIYGSRGDEILTENSAPGSDFLARVVIDWENAAQSAEAFGVRVVNLRFAVVLGKGGALAKMLPPFRVGLGGRLGSGKQWMSWVHIEDAVDLILFALANDPVHGPLNVAAPNPVRNAEFTRQLAEALHRPAIFPVPPFALRLLFGEMADSILASQRVVPAAAESAYFRFRFPDLAPALDDLLSK
jgi:uncharacterized protein